MGVGGKGKHSKSFFMVVDGVREEVKRCKMCKEIKKAEDFYSHKIKIKYGVGQYLQSYCKDCKRLFEREFAEKTNRKSSNLFHWKSYKMKYRSKPISYDIYEELLEYQEHKCAICGADDSFNQLAMDHDHETGEVRGLLCHGCNRNAVGIYESCGRYRTEHHTEAIKKYLSDPPINHIPTSVKHGWIYENGVIPSPSDDVEMEEVVIQSPMYMFEEDE